MTQTYHSSPLVSSSDVNGTNVYGRHGEKVGSIVITHPLVLARVF
jgi:hypothetical protein